MTNFVEVVGASEGFLLDALLVLCFAAFFIAGLLLCLIWTNSRVFCVGFLVLSSAFLCRPALAEETIYYSKYERTFAVPEGETFPQYIWAWSKGGQIHIKMSSGMFHLNQPAFEYFFYSWNWIHRPDYIVDPILEAGPHVLDSGSELSAKYYKLVYGDTYPKTLQSEEITTGPPKQAALAFSWPTIHLRANRNGAISYYAYNRISADSEPPPPDAMDTVDSTCPYCGLVESYLFDVTGNYPSPCGTKELNLSNQRVTNYSTVFAMGVELAAYDINGDLAIIRMKGVIPVSVGYGGLLTDLRYMQLWNFGFHPACLEWRLNSYGFVPEWGTPEKSGLALSFDFSELSVDGNVASCAVHGGLVDPDTPLNYNLFPTSGDNFEIIDGMYFALDSNGDPVTNAPVNPDAILEPVVNWDSPTVASPDNQPIYILQADSELAALNALRNESHNTSQASGAALAAIKASVDAAALGASRAAETLQELIEGADGPPLVYNEPSVDVSTFVNTTGQDVSDFFNPVANESGSSLLSDLFPVSSITFGSSLAFWEPITFSLGDREFHWSMSAPESFGAMSGYIRSLFLFILVVWFVYEMVDRVRGGL